MPGSPAPLDGVVYDSLARAPLVGATVQAVRADDRSAARTTTTDSAGHFHLDSLPAGRYLIGFLHPDLDVLGIELSPTVIDLANGPRALLALSTPGPLRVRRAVCPTLAASDSAGAIAGAVRDADTGTPVADATVVITWNELTIGASGVHTERRRVPVTVRPDGGFLVCGVPSDGPLSASATAPGRTSGVVEVAPPVRGVALQSFALGPVAHADTATSGTASGGAASAHGAAVESDGLPTPARGTARLAGRVVGPDGRPVRGARVSVWGSAARDTTNDDGRFTLAALPAGTFTLEARAIGLEPTRQAVDLASGRTAEVRIGMPKALPVLERVVVKGKQSSGSRALDGFLARRRTGMGHYLSQADIERLNPLELTDVLRTTPGVHVVPSGARGNVLRGRGNCVPNVFLDGTPVYNGANEIDDIVRPETVAAIEVYSGGATVPVQFNLMSAGGALTGNAGCGGAVVIWTKR